MNIKTAYERKPGRVDGPKPFPFDWEAWDDDTYTGEPGDPLGFGATEAEAIADLMVQIEEEDDYYRSKADG
jgi:hypothetical protein